MKAEGVTFRTSVEVGRSLPADRLSAESDAIVICAGATRPRDLQAAGRELSGIHFAIDYLKENTRRLLAVEWPKGALNAEGKDVLVIGGGDTGTDCVGTAIRQSCRSVHQIEIMPKPPLERTPGNPWPQWPAILRTDYGQEEAIALTGSDPRIYLTTVSRFEGDGRGNLRTVHTVGVQWNRLPDGRMVPEPVPGTEKAWPAQLVLLAMASSDPRTRCRMPSDWRATAAPTSRRPPTAT